MVILFLGFILDIIFITITYPLIYLSLKVSLKKEISFRIFYLDLISHAGDNLREVLYNG